MENTDKKIFNIQKENLPKLKTKIGFIQKKAAKLGVTVPYFAVIKEWQKEVKEKSGKTYLVEMVEVEVDNVKTALSGWNFLATVDHHEAGNVIRFSPKYKGESNVEKYRNSKPDCDHCQHQRKRKDTFIMINEAGETKQIGRSCIKDFLGHKSAEYYAELADLVWTISQEDDEDNLSYGSKWVEVFQVLEVLEAAAMIIRLNGYRSAKACMNGGATTSNKVSYWFGTDEKKYKEETKEDKPKVEDQDKKVAQEAYQMALGWEGKDLGSEFNVNLHILCKRGTAVGRDLGMLCYLPEMLMKTIAKQIEDAARNKAQKELAQKSQYVGNLKERLTLELDLVRMIWLGSSQFGDSYLYSFSDAQGNVIVWKTGVEYGIQAGSKVKLVGTVKEQSEYRGVKQTSLTRCKMSKIEDSQENNSLKEA